MVTLRLFGGAGLETEDGPLTGSVAQRQRLALLALLAMAKNGSLSRDSILAYLWPESDGEKARHALSNAIYSIRKNLGENVLQGVGEDLRLNRDVIEVDVHAFEGAINQQDLERAARLYTGPFLDGFSLNSPEFERWIDGERSRLAQVYHDTLEALARQAGEEGRAREAVNWWRRAAAHDPYSSRTAVGFMSALNAAGDSASALKHARIHRTLLENELDIKPDPAVEELAERIRNGRGPRMRAQPAVETTAKDTPRAVGHGAISHPGRDIWLFAVVSLAVLGVVYALTLALGLPDWVTMAATVLLIIGLPVVVLTGKIERRRAKASTTGAAPAPARKTEGLIRRVTWRNAVLGGVFAFAGLGLVVTAYMTMRLVGIGPVATLVAAGLLSERERIVLAEFESSTGDSALGAAVTEAFRTDLAQSPVVTLLRTRAVRGALRRMERDLATPLGSDLARELALREGVKGVVTGEVNSAGPGFVLSAQLISASDGAVLAARRETAADSSEVIPAIDRLSKRLRERIGESLKTIRRNEPLDKVTTASLEALTKYSQAVRAIELDLDYQRAIPLLEHAIHLDTAFAMAYRKLGVFFGNTRTNRARRMEVLTKAYEHRDRLTDIERYYTLGTYWAAHRNFEKAIVAYRTLLETYPNDLIALNNLGVQYELVGEKAKAEELYLRARAIEPNNLVYHVNIVEVQAGQGKFDEAEKSLDRLAQVFPDHPAATIRRAALAASRGDYDTTEQHILTLREDQSGSPQWRAITDNWLYRLSRIRGQLLNAERHLRDRMEVEDQRRSADGYINAALNIAWLDLAHRGAPADGMRDIETALVRYPVDSLTITDNTFFELANLFIWGGEVERAKAMMDRFERSVDPELQRTIPVRHLPIANIAQVEERYDDAIAEMREWARELPGCAICTLNDLAWAHDRAGKPDSVIAILERYIETPRLFRLFLDSFTLPWAYRRLGELYEARGEPEKAVDYYNRFVEIWKAADPDLQPQVQDVRRRLVRLVGEPVQGK